MIYRIILLIIIFLGNHAAMAQQTLKIYAQPTNKYNDSAISFKYLSSFGTNNRDDNCSGDDVCSSATTITNNSASAIICESDYDEYNEGYNVCAVRDPCTELTNECMQNEIDIQNAITNNQSIDSYLVIRTYCNESLLPLCNAKKGMDRDSSQTILTTSTTAVDPKAYGWFNELCLSSGPDSNGFDYALRDIIAHNPNNVNNNVMGKCLIDQIHSPYMTDNNAQTNCDEGGRAPNCLCIEYIEGISSISTEHIVRKETRREAGLCIDVPIAETCPVIKHNTFTNPINLNDPHYVSSSIGYSSYGNTINDISGVVHLSHKERTDAKASSNYAFSPADFPVAVMGMQKVEGVCQGFWQNDLLYGKRNPPMRDCLNDNGTAIWSNTITNDCVRYQCRAVNTIGPIRDSNPMEYYGNYAKNDETSEYIGQYHGYATWPSHLKTNDFVENTNFIADYEPTCLIGFKKSGASPIYNGDKITNYSGGTPPHRDCNQLGSWSAASNICQRITCPAITPATTPQIDWTAWSNTAGASFGETLASRSDAFQTPGSIAYGDCNESLGYFQLGNEAPSRHCDHLGNWGPVINKCTTQCDAVSGGIDHGYASWDGVFGLLPGQSEILTAASCMGGYYPYPYVPLKNSSGISYNLVENAADADYETTIPQNINEDTRNINDYPLPQRTCDGQSYSGITANIWTATSSRCINKCPGANSDPRIGVGVTRHNIHSQSLGILNKDISWPESNLGQWVYAVSSSQGETFSAGNNPDLKGQTVSHYIDYTDSNGEGRTNGSFIVARKCGYNGKWEDPIVQCSGQQGLSADGTATYDGTTRNNVKTVDVGSVIGGSTGGRITATRTKTDSKESCVAGSSYYRKDINSNNPKPIIQYSCEYKNDNKAINQTYFKEVSGTGHKCQKYCKAVHGRTYGGRQYYNGNTYYFSDGDRRNLVCNSGKCQNSSGAPSMLCGNGNWSVSNLCRDCSNCRHNASVDSIGHTVGNRNSGESWSHIDAGTTVVGVSSRDGKEDCKSNGTKHAYHTFNIDEVISGSHGWSFCTNYTINHNNCVIYTINITNNCNKGETQTRAYFRLRCLDGSFRPESYSGNKDNENAACAYHITCMDHNH